MRELVLNVDQVSKKYKDFYALNQVSLQLEPGRIYGLIGKNGAGKTTLMRMIAGLSFPTSGSIQLFGKKTEREFTKELSRVGCLIEYPTMNGDMTALENLRLHRIIRGIPEKSRDEELLEMVGLKDVGKKKVKKFSLGMRQRLGIAIAAIGKPELLILDEPVNGLDPVGVVEIRNLIKGICEKYHTTILISSHNLPEMYQVATDYIIIDQGQIKKQLTAEELDEICSHYLSIECDEPERLAQVVETQLGTTRFRIMPDKSMRLFDFIDDRKKVSQTLIDSGIVVTKFAVEGESLEQYFINVIGGGENV